MWTMVLLLHLSERGDGRLLEAGCQLGGPLGVGWFLEDYAIEAALGFPYFRLGHLVEFWFFSIGCWLAFLEGLFCQIGGN